MTRLSTVLSAADLPLAELCAARLDGELFVVDECFAFGDLPVGPAERGQALAAIRPGRGIADHDSAAWLHGALDRSPTVHTFALSTAKRSYVAPSIRLRMHEVVLPSSDVLHIGGCDVTTPLRTLTDLARTRASWAEQDADTLLRLAAIAGSGQPAILRYLADAPRLPGKKLARHRIRDAFTELSRR